MDERDDWVADVRRWCLTHRQTPSDGTGHAGGEHDSSELGYEAAHPVLQSRHWPDAPRSELGSLG